MQIYRNNKQLIKIPQEIRDDYKIIGKYKDSNKVYLVFECLKCREDSELFGKGVFYLNERAFKTGVKACGCAKKPRWTEHQYMVRVMRVLGDDEIAFVSWAGDFIGYKTKIIFSCREHGEFEGNTINDCLRYRIFCPECNLILLRDKRRRPDSGIIARFKETGSYVDGTIFSRSEKLSPKGFREYWDVFCPICETSYTSLYKSLTSGALGCECSNYRQRTLYVLKVVDNCEIIAYKFGIANNVESRIKALQRSTEMILEIYKVWQFKNKEDCISVETSVKRNFNTRFLSSDVMGSGWSETISPTDIEVIERFLDKSVGV